MSRSRTREQIVEEFNGHLNAAGALKKSGDTSFKTMNERVLHLKDAISLNDQLVKMSTGDDKERLMKKGDQLQQIKQQADEALFKQYPLGQSKTASTDSPVTDAKRQEGEAKRIADDNARKAAVVERSKQQQAADAKKYFGNNAAAPVPPPRTETAQYDRNREFGQKKDNTMDMITKTAELMKTLPLDKQQLFQKDFNTIMMKVIATKFNSLSSKELSNISESQLATVRALDKEVSGFHKLVSATAALSNSKVQEAAPSNDNSNNKSTPRMVRK